MATEMDASKKWPRGQPPHVAPSDDGVTRVVHMKRFHGEIIQNCDVYIGRRNDKGGWDLPQSKWGNPFKMKDYKDGRGNIIKDYRDWVTSRPDLMESLHELKGKRLGCWCKPEACHGDVLVELVNKHCAEDGAQTTITPDAQTSAKPDTFDLTEDFPSLGEQNLKPKHKDGKTAAHKVDAANFDRGATASEVKHKEKETLDSAHSGADIPDQKVDPATKAKVDDAKSKRRRNRTPHLHTKNTNTPKWQSK